MTEANKKAAPVKRGRPSVVKVRAIQRGYYGGVIREVGDEFTVPSKRKLGKWMERV